MTKPTRPTADIRRRLLAGEPLSAAQVAGEYGVSKSLLGQVVTGLEGEGVTVTRERTDPPLPKGAKLFRVTTPEPTASHSEWGKAKGVRSLHDAANPPGRKRAAAMTTTPAAAMVRAAVNGKGSSLEHPVPQLGESVQVFLLALGDDGAVNVGLRDGERTWLTTVSGFSAR